MMKLLRADVKDRVKVRLGWEAGKCWASSLSSCLNLMSVFLYFVVRHREKSPNVNFTLNYGRIQFCLQSQGSAYWTCWLSVADRAGTLEKNKACAELLWHVKWSAVKKNRKTTLWLADRELRSNVQRKINSSRWNHNMHRDERWSWRRCHHWEHCRYKQ